MPASPLAPSHEAFERAVSALEDGHCIVIPTDTLYGLAASLDRPEAIDRLFELKGRPAGVPIAVLVASSEQAEALVEFTPLASQLAETWWPGPLTLVLDGRADVAERVGSDTGTVGVRLPDHDLVRALAERVGPLATTSANRHGEPTAAEATGVAEALPDVEVVLDGGRCGEVASTVLDARGDQPVVLRQGAVSI